MVSCDGMGSRREAVFLDDADREAFLATLGQACAGTGRKVHAWVLMNNHYHLLMRTPEANLVDGMKWLQNTFTRHFNTRHRHWGFEQRTCPTSFANWRRSKGKPFGVFLIYDDCPLLFPCDALQQEKTLPNRPYLNAIPH